MGASVPCFLHPDKEGSGRVGAGIRPSQGPAFLSSSHLSLPGRGLCPHEPLGQVPADRPWYEPGTAQDDHPEPSPTDPRPCCRPLPFPQVLDVPLTVKLRTGVQERVNLAHRLLPDLRDWGAALVTVGLGAQWASGPRGTSLSNYPSLPSPLLVSGSPSISCLRLSVSLSLSLSPSLPGSLGLFLSLSMVLCFPGPSFPPHTAASPPAPWPLAGAALHQAGRLAVHRAVRGSSPPHAPFRWVPTGHTPRPTPHLGPSLPRWGAPGWRELLMPWDPCLTWLPETPASVPQGMETSCPTKMPTGPCRLVSRGS